MSRNASVGLPAKDTAPEGRRLLTCRWKSPKEQQVRLGGGLRPGADPRCHIIFACFVDHQTNRFE